MYIKEIKTPWYYKEGSGGELQKRLVINGRGEEVVEYREVRLRYSLLRRRWQIKPERTLYRVLGTPPKVMWYTLIIPPEIALAGDFQIPSELEKHLVFGNKARRCWYQGKARHICELCLWVESKYPDYQRKIGKFAPTYSSWGKTPPGEGDILFYV